MTPAPKWKRGIVLESAKILDVMRNIDTSVLQIALVVDADKKLIGVVTDGDIRRGILRGISLDMPVSRIMNKRCSTVRPETGREEVLRLMKTKALRQIPIVNEVGKLFGLHLIDDLLTGHLKENQVILMAGGMGTRLGKLTEQCPKPLLRVGEKPVLETILENFIEFGFHRFFFSINYKAEMIEEYFGTGEKWGVTIEYLRERRRGGTAGALGMLPKPDQPLFVMNGDILTKVNMQYLLDFHQTHKAQATMCVREFRFQVPYGVIQADRRHLVAIEEKPDQRFFVNAGIYVLDPSVLDLVKPNQYLDMPDLFKRILRKKQETLVFPIREYWIDIGKRDDFDRAQSEFGDVFS
ncbi:MAG: nucleotidyltransferase family protein [Candidatus Ozemobacteraceae bacterium]